MTRYLNCGKFLALILIALSCMVFTVSAEPSWMSTSGCWTVSNSTHTFVMFNQTVNDSWSIPFDFTGTLNYIVVGGGGAGRGGGGGAGGVVIQNVSVVASGVMRYSVGRGGDGQLITNLGKNGTASELKYGSKTSIANGGGGGSIVLTYAGAGGSGGGGANGVSYYGLTNQPTTGDSAGYGHNGGVGDGNAGGGGGGGATVGSNSPDMLQTGGNGGSGIGLRIADVLTYFGGGGGGSSGTGSISNGGSGGGGKGGQVSTTTYALNGTPSTGGGGGGGVLSGEYTGGGSGVIIVWYASPTPTYITSSFSIQNTSIAINTTTNSIEGNIPLSVQFTNTSMGATQTSWVWNYTKLGVSEPVTFNSSAFYNPIYTFSTAGNYSISLNATGGAYSNISTQQTWINATQFTMIYPSFTTNVSSGKRPLAVKFTDTTTNINATPDTWYWDFDDGNTSTLRNPENLFVTPGVYNVTLTVANYSFGSRTTFGYIDAFGTRGVNVDYHTMYQRYTVVISFTDSDTGSVVPYVLVSDSNGYSTNATTGVYSNTYDYSTVTIYYSANGYLPGSRTFAVTGDTTKTIAMTPTGLSNKNSVSLTNTVYATLHFTEGFGTPISGVIITAVPYNTSMGDYSFLESLLGIPLSSAAIESETMHQISGSDGKGSFYALPTTYYRFTFSKSGYTFNPSEIFTSFEGTQDIYIVGSSNTSTSYLTNSTDQLTAISYSVETVKINSTAYFLNVSYDDTTGSTTSGTITITQKSTVPYTADTVVASIPITSSSEEYSTVIHSSSFEVSGTSALVVNTGKFGNVQRDAFYTIKGQPVSFMGFGGEIALLFALFIMMMTVMLGTAGPTARQVTVAGLCAELWIFYAIGWFQSLIDRGVSEQVLIIGMIIVSIMAIVGVFELRKKKEKY